MITEVELSVEERTQIAEDEIQKALLETDLRRTLSMIARALLQVGPNPNLEAKSARADLFYRVYHICAASSLWEESSDELELTDLEICVALLDEDFRPDSEKLEFFIDLFKRCGVIVVLSSAYSVIMGLDVIVAGEPIDQPEMNHILGILTKLRARDLMTLGLPLEYQDSSTS